MEWEPVTRSLAGIKNHRRNILEKEKFQTIKSGPFLITKIIINNTTINTYSRLNKNITS